MTTYVKQMQRIVDEYRLEDLPWPTSAKNIADWAISLARGAGNYRQRQSGDVALTISLRPCAKNI